MKKCRWGSNPGLRMEGAEYSAEPYVYLVFYIKFNFKIWAIPGLFFLYFCLFNTVDSKQMFNNFYQ